MALDIASRSRSSVPWINIVFPVRNEEGRLKSGIEKTIAFFVADGFDDFLLTIVDNQSTDSTFELATQLAKQYSCIDVLRIEEKGVGVAFREAVRANKSPIVGYMDIDLATDLRHMREVIKILQEDECVQFVNGSRWANGYGTTGRGISRTMTSMGLTTVLKLFLHMKASDAICGFKFFRNKAAEKLIGQADPDENGWFFIIEMLLIAERSGMNIRELPVSWTDDGNSSVEVISVIRNYLAQIVKLRRRLFSGDLR